MKAMKAILMVVFAVMMAVPAFAAKDAAVTKMEAKLAKDIDASSAEKGVKALVKKSLIPLISDPVFVKEVKAQNKKKVKLAEIKKIDTKWQDAEEDLPIFKEKMTNACAKQIIKLIKGIPAVEEAFVMDDQGAVVGENVLTSDYWQGDEPKWSNSYNKGKGGLDVGKVKFDASTNKNLQQVSLPIVDEKGVVIGAVTFGINVDKL